MVDDALCENDLGIMIASVAWLVRMINYGRVHLEGIGIKATIVPQGLGG